MPNPELAWAAGFFDGEGSFGVDRKRPYRYLTASLSQTDPRPLCRFVAAVGMGNVTGPTRETSRLSRKCKWRVQFSGTKAVAVATALTPHLSPPKLEQLAKAWKEVNDGDQPRG